MRPYQSCDASMLGRSTNLPSLRILNVRHNQTSADAVIDFKDTDLAGRLWRLETDHADPPPRRQWFETH